MTRDTFIPRHLRPKHKVLQDQFLDLFFSSDDDDFDPRIFEVCCVFLCIEFCVFVVSVFVVVFDSRVYLNITRRLMIFIREN